MTAAYFHAGSEGFVPQANAFAPWSADMLHGRLLGGLAARALEIELAGPGWRAARLTVDLFRPAAMTAVTVTTRVVRQGRRIRVGDAVMVSQGHEVARASVMMLAAGDEPPGQIWRPDAVAWPDPLTVPRDPDATEPESDWMVRPVEGGFASAQRGRVWTRERASLVDGEPLTPFVRAAMSADLACPLANGSDQGLHYINGDYTLALGRYPEGEWIGVMATQQIAADGISIASSDLIDERGSFATSTGASLATAPLHTPNGPPGP